MTEDIAKVYSNWCCFVDEEFDTTTYRVWYNRHALLILAFYSLGSLVTMTIASTRYLCTLKPQWRARSQQSLRHWDLLDNTFPFIYCLKVTLRSSNLQKLSLKRQEIHRLATLYTGKLVHRRGWKLSCSLSSSLNWLSWKRKEVEETNSEVCVVHCLSLLA